MKKTQCTHCSHTYSIRAEDIKTEMKAYDFGDVYVPYSKCPSCGTRNMHDDLPREILEEVGEKAIFPYGKIMPDKVCRRDMRWFSFWG